MPEKYRKIFLISIAVATVAIFIWLLMSDFEPREPSLTTSVCLESHEEVSQSMRYNLFLERYEPFTERTTVCDRAEPRPNPAHAQWKQDHAAWVERNRSYDP